MQKSVPSDDDVQCVRSRQTATGFRKQCKDLLLRQLLTPCSSQKEAFVLVGAQDRSKDAQDNLDSLFVGYYVPRARHSFAFLARLPLENLLRSFRFPLVRIACVPHVRPDTDHEPDR